MVINGQQAIKIPEKDNILKFNNFHTQVPVPFVIYADFEVITEKIQGSQPNIDKSYTETYQNIKTVGMDIRLFVVIIINTPNHFKFIEEKMLYTN